MIQGGTTATPGLEKSLRPRHVEMIAVGGIIGAGLFVGSSAAIASTGPAAVLSYLGAGVVVLLVMRMLAEMASTMPGTGAFTDYIRASLGHWAGFLSGWLYWYTWVIVIAIEAIAGGQLLAVWVPLPAWQLGLALLAVLSAINLASTRSFGEFEFWFSMVKVVAILLFILVLAGFVFGFASSPSPGLSNLTGSGGFAPNGYGAAMAGIVTVIFSMMGAEVATIAATEAADGSRAIAGMTLRMVARIIVFYVLSILLIVTVVPWSSVIPGDSPFALALDAVAIPYAGAAMNLVVLVAVLSCLNSGIYVTSRVLFGLAAQGDAPQALVAVNGRRVPARAIVLSTLFGYGAIAASYLAPSAVFAFLVNATGCLSLLIYCLLILAHIRFRRRIEREGRAVTLPMWLFPWLSYLALFAIAAILWSMLRTPELAPQFYASCLAVAVTFALYVARSAFSGPRRSPKPAVVAQAVEAPSA